jgi:sugar phosphate permease
VSRIAVTLLDGEQGMSADYRIFLVVTLPLAAMNLINQASRTVMSIIGPVLAVELSLSASELGLLAACMFAAYALAQLPVGVTLDMYGPRRVQTALCILAALGFAVFALSDRLTGFAIARVVLGVAISAGLTAILKANSQWFAPTRVAGMTGLAMVVGSLGSVATTAPVEAVLPELGWRNVFWILTGASLLVAAWIFLSVRDRPGPAVRRSLWSEFRVTLAVCNSQPFWRYGPAIAMLSVLNFAYLGLWAGPWLRDVAGYDGATRAHTLLLYTLGMMAGALIIGQVSGRVQARGYPAILVPSLCIAGLVSAQVGLILRPVDPAAVTILWVAFAFFGAGGPAGYVAVNQMFPSDQTGRVSTAINTLTLGGAFLLQAAIGWILDLWPRTASDGWDPRGYSAALALSVVLHLIAALRLIGWNLPWRRANG